ncbi:DUF1659 domain-containing protein [Anaeromicrobium sediminis]
MKKTKAYLNLKHDTSNEDVYAVASSLIDLQPNMTLELTKLNESELIGE